MLTRLQNQKRSSGNLPKRIERLKESFNKGIKKEVKLKKKLRLGVNVDHVATVRNARGSQYPDPTSAAKMAKKAGADGITAHLREDRRHINENDIKTISLEVDLPLNLEMAATIEMREIALKYKPNAVCLVPENRLELTTEGGLNVKGNHKFLGQYITPLIRSGCKVSVFLNGDKEQIDAAKDIGATTVELHTGIYCDLHNAQKFKQRDIEFDKLRQMAEYARLRGLEVHAGHGLTLETVATISGIKEIEELNIGHSLISESIFFGLFSAIKIMRTKMEEGRSRDKNVS